MRIVVLTVAESVGRSGRSFDADFKRIRSHGHHGEVPRSLRNAVVFAGEAEGEAKVQVLYS